MLYVGLTGGIASGKSVVAARLAESGCAVLDLDRVAHEVMAPTGPAYTEVVAAFGMDALAPDGTIDRKLLGARVFRDRSELERLNAIVHPIVGSEEARRVAALAAAGAEVVVSEAALLIETGLHLRFDRLVVVHCAPEQQRRRLELRNRLSPEDAQARLAAQMSSELSLTLAHRVVDTCGSVEESERSATLLADELMTLARRPRDPRPSRERLRASLAIAAPSSASLAGRFIEDVVEARTLDLRRIAQVFGHGGEPWYEPRTRSAHAPIEVAVPVVVHLLQRPFGNDADLLASALASVGRAFGNDPADWAEACALGLAAARWLAGGPTRGDSWRESIRLAERWTGVALAPSVQPAELLRRLAAEAPMTVPAPLAESFERFLALAR